MQVYSPSIPLTS